MGREVKLAAGDPTLNVKVKTKPKRKGGYPPWTDEEMAKFEARWPRGTRERVMFDILAYTGLRIGDVAMLGRQHVAQSACIRGSDHSEKTGMRVEMPLLPQLKETIEAGRPATLPLSSPGAARLGTRARWGPNLSTAARAAGVVGKSAHGMRKAAATRAAENGATERELEAIFGWSGGRMATLYTRAPTAAGLRRGPSAS